MIINIHAGHNPDGKTACGAVGLIKESTEARNVKNEVKRLLKEHGHTVYDCTITDGTSQSDVLNKIIKKANAHKADLDISIHFNAGASETKGNGRTAGTEVLLYSGASRAKPYAERVLKQIASLGFKSRGIKYRTDLAVLRHTSSPAMLIECCFVDDKDDAVLYDCKAMAKAITEGILNKSLERTAAVKQRAAFRSGTKTGKETFIRWLNPGTKVTVVRGLTVGKTDWLQVKVGNSKGYVVQSKMEYC